MVDGVYVINKTSSIPIFTRMIDESRNFIGEDLIGGLMSAIIKFGEHVQIGQITNFDSAEHRVVVASSPNNILAFVFDPRKHRVQDPHTLSYYLLEEFEKNYPEVTTDPLPTELNTQSFSETVTRALNLNVMPFYYTVVRWASKEFGGNVFVRQEQFTAEEDHVVIDIVIDRGKKEDKGIMDRISEKLIGEDFSKDVIYIKVVEGQAGSGEIDEFFKLCSTFGRRRERNGLPSFFPSLAVVVARSYSPTVPRILDKLTIKGTKHILTPKAAPRIAKMVSRPPKSHQCNIQLWEWKEEYPDLLYE